LLPGRQLRARGGRAGKGPERTRLGNWCYEEIPPPVFQASAGPLSNPPSPATYPPGAIRERGTLAQGPCAGLEWVIVLPAGLGQRSRRRIGATLPCAEPDRQIEPCPVLPVPGRLHTPRCQLMRRRRFLRVGCDRSARLVALRAGCLPRVRS